MRTITASFSGRQTFVTTESLWQYDYGFILVLEGLNLPAYYEVHFSHTFTQLADVNIGDANGVVIDDKFLRKDGYLYAWVYLHDEITDGYTKYQVKIPIAKRAQPPEDPPTQEQEEALAQAITALNEQTGRAEAWAVGQRNGEDVPEGDETYHNNAAYYARLAEQGAEEAGYAWFDINNEDGNMYVTVTANLDSDVSFEIDESTGILEVIINE